MQYRIIFGPLLYNAFQVRREFYYVHQKLEKQDNLLGLKAHILIIYTVL